MKILLYSLSTLLFLSLLFFLFTWAVAYGSGHNIPNEMDHFFIIVILIHFALIGALCFRLRAYGR